MKSQTLLKELSSLECQDATYIPKISPIVLNKSEGSIIFDLKGKSYVDLCAGFGALTLGHNHPSLKKIFKNLSSKKNSLSNKIIHGLGDVYPSLEKILLLEELKKFFPKQSIKIALCTSGGQAVEYALKTAILKTKKSGFIVFDNSYHGLDLGVLPLTYRSDFKKPFRSFIKEKNIISLPYNCDDLALKKAIAKLEKSVGFAGIVAEPVQGRSGVILANKNWLLLLKRMCEQKKQS